MDPDPRHGEWLLRLSLVEGVGPILGRRLIEAFGSPRGIFDAAPDELTRIRGIGAAKARIIFRGLHESRDALEREQARAAALGARIVALGTPGYPPMLARTPDAPLVLYARGALPAGENDYCVAVVGSRHCSAYGIEQAERFAAALGEAGLVIVSGGARGIDSAAHRAAIRVGARTVAVLGCGLAHCYPPENADLYARMIESGGCVLSELPMDSPPAAENFPARNRIIAGLSLGTLVIEAPTGSGALITARLAVDEYGREVMAVPGRVDSAASEGSNDLIRKGEAALVARPSDVVEILESIAHRQHMGPASARLAALPEDHAMADVEPEESARGGTVTSAPNRKTGAPAIAEAGLSETQRVIVRAIDGQALTVDAICRATGLEAGVVQAESTILEIRRVVVRDGGGRLGRRGLSGE